MRKQISVTHEKVIELFEAQENVSKYIEKCVLAYEDFREHDYITREEVLDLLKEWTTAGPGRTDSNGRTNDDSRATAGRDKVKMQDLSSILNL